MTEAPQSRRRGARGMLIVFARVPRPGGVKTRLSPPFSPEEASALYERMLDDVLEVSGRAAAALGLEPVLAVDLARGRGVMATHAPSHFRVVTQRGADLAARMANAVDEAAAAGATPVLLRGSDSPTLTTDTIERALLAIEADKDVAICPDLDGGYNLIGLRQPVKGLFHHPMSTRHVLEDTIANAEAQGLRVEVFEPGFDIDVAGDLVWLARAARRVGPPPPCPRTLAFLDETGLWRHCATSTSRRSRR